MSQNVHTDIRFTLNREGLAGAEHFLDPVVFGVLDSQNYVGFLPEYPERFKILGVEAENEEALVQLLDAMVDRMRKTWGRSIRFVCETEPKFLEGLLLYGFKKASTILEDQQVYDYRVEVEDDK